MPSLLRTLPFSPTAYRRPTRSGFSLVEVVIAVGIFAVAVLSILGLLLPNTKAVADQIDANVAQRLAENIQLELQRYGFEAVKTALPPPYNPNAKIFMVATKDGSRVLMTGEDPYTAWADTYTNYNPNASGNYSTVTSLHAAENALESATTPGNPAGIAFRDRFFLIEVSWPDVHPQYADGRGYFPLNVRVVWPYRLPNGPAAPTATSAYNALNELPWTVVAPSAHSSILFNVVVTP